MRNVAPHRPFTAAHYTSIYHDHRRLQRGHRQGHGPRPGQGCHHGRQDHHGDHPQPRFRLGEGGAHLSFARERSPKKAKSLTPFPAPITHRCPLSSPAAPSGAPPTISATSRPAP